MSKYFTIKPTKQALSAKDYTDQNLKWEFTDHVRGQKTTIISKRAIVGRLKNALAPEADQRDWNIDIFLWGRQMAKSKMDFMTVQKYAGAQGYTCANRYWKLLTQGVYWAYEDDATKLLFDVDDDTQNVLLDKDPLVQAYADRAKHLNTKRKPESSSHTHPTNQDGMYALIKEQHQMMKEMLERIKLLEKQQTNPAVTPPAPEPEQTAQETPTLNIPTTVTITDIGFNTEAFTYDEAAVWRGKTAPLYNSEGERCGVVRFWSESNMPEGVSKDDIHEDYWNKDGYLKDDDGQQVYIFKIEQSWSNEKHTYYSHEWIQEFGELRENENVKLE